LLAQQVVLKKRKFLDNEIFALEREISDCNSRYNMLMAKRAGPNSNEVSTQIHQIMQQLEEKTELLFRLRKERQDVIAEECRLV